MFLIPGSPHQRAANMILFLIISKGVIENVQRPQIAVTIEQQT